MADAPLLFGTDGIRAPFGEHPLDRDTVTDLGFQLGSLLREAEPSPVIVLGGDTRDSTPTLCRWLADGLTAAGARCRFLGVAPTPLVAWAVRHLQAACGAAVSASHNPWPDNGIKLFDGRGRKWSSSAEAGLEERLGRPRPAIAEGSSSLQPEAAMVEAYLDGLIASLPPGQRLSDLSVVSDSAHGATSGLAGRLFASAGARVIPLFAEPDGCNINQGCGSTHPEAIAGAVREQGADLGVAFDGDGDRVLLVDERGEVRDGDALLFLWALGLASKGELEPRKIVATSMSNLGLERSLEPWAVEVVRCDVGDRAVAEAMERHGILLGGEQSGHLIHSGLASTGDGLLTALHLAAFRAASGRPLSELLDGFRRLPQILHNVRVPKRIPFDDLPRVVAARDRVTRELGSNGRLILRYSGTERLARIMLEGPDPSALERWAGELEAVLVEELRAEG
jgi:phosphoglucosamine mutase